jgi:sec-independent protein translocase protein TatA
MFGLGTTELILILVIVVIFFGAGKLPDVGAGIAKGIKNFKKNLNDEKAPENPVIEAEKSGVSHNDKQAESTRAEHK